MSGPCLRILFDGPPSHKSGRFVECEDAAGASVNAGEWSEEGGFHVLTVRSLPGDTRAACIAELKAELLNERGEGEPPSPGWTVKGDAWERRDAAGAIDTQVYRVLDGGLSGWSSWCRALGGDTRHADTARQGMRAMDVLRGEGQ